MIIIYIISIIPIIIGIIELFLMILNKNKNSSFNLIPNTYNNFCIIIPARNESLVIEKLLISIENQTLKVPSSNVYIIVESKQDKTISIANNHHMNIIYRKDLSKRRKCFAIDDCLKELQNKGIYYDAYFIFDADNILDKNFIKNMSKSINEGYDIAIGYRNTKNGNDNVVAAASSLTFSLINTLGNHAKQKHNSNVTISGTGYYIMGYLIKKWGSFPFTSLTEDYELTLYSTLHNLKTTYNKEAIYYDEQPTSYNTTITQRTRWIKGYFESRHKYIPLIKKSLNNKANNYGSRYTTYLGVKPYINIIIGLILLMLLNITSHIFILIPVLIYLVLFILTIIMLIKENNTLSLNNITKIKVLFYNPIFLSTYLICLIKSILIKDVKWSPINHTTNK